MLHVGIIGAGFMGRTHGDAYKKLADVRLAGIASRGQEKARQFAEDYQCPNYSQPEELIAHPEIDIIDICLPTHLHEQYVVLAAAHGKHVLCEKPFSLTLEAADRMIEATRKAGIKFMIAQVLRFWPEYMKIKELCDQGAPGKINMIYANRLAQFPNWGDWFQDVEKSGGALFDLHLHDIDYLRYLLGPVRSVYAVGKQDANGAWNHVVSILNFANGARAVAEGSNQMAAGYPFTMSLRAVGEQGTIDFSFKAGFNLEERASAANAVVLYREGQSPEVLDVVQKDGYLHEIEYFMNCVKNDIQPAVVTPEESREVLQLVLALKESLESGQVVQIA
ncbi:oxidoreductase domain protein [Candidatus Vecturithrix granuli]|uniref:Oxidoreductase domain protein n=1 Tax=Vecturithrix granuli TaxID=1499967 RepID=A0A081C576_VECG1|nr:oxidoreductase domain protein [Candidatus Vecturithrix granuli]